MSENKDCVNENDPAEQEQKPDINKYKGHFALAGKDRGCSGAFLGSVCLVGFLINDRSCTWTDEDIKQIKKVLSKAADYLKTESKLSDRRLSISYAFDSVPIQHKFDRYGYLRSVTAVLQQYGFDDAASYQEHYEQKFKKSEAPIIFFINRNFRSFAVDSKSQDPSPHASEFCFVSFEPDDIKGCVRSLIHEVLHQFGAIDYYYPDRVKKVALKKFPESVMLHGLKVDDLTRYLIGWDSVPSEAALSFLEETADVTAEEIAEAYEKDRDRDW